MRIQLTFAILLLPINAVATELGDRGTIALGGTIGASYMKADAAGRGNSALLFNSTVDAFVAENVSLGVGAGIARIGTTIHDAGSERFVHSTAYDLSPRVGLFVPISERAALWPVASIGYARHVQEQFGSRAVRGTLSLQFVYAVSDHLHLRFSPGSLTVQRSFADSGNATSVHAGLNAIMGIGLGGWF